MEQVFNKERIFTFIFIMLGVEFATAITINSGGSGGFL